MKNKFPIAFKYYYNTIFKLIDAQRNMILPILFTGLNYVSYSQTFEQK